MELHILDLGRAHCDYGVVVPGHRDGEFVDLPVLSFLVRLDDGRVALIDTGMSRDHIENPNHAYEGTPYTEIISALMRPEDDIITRLADAGFTPNDVDLVINTHLHFDHAGNNFLFPNAKIYVQRDQYEIADGNDDFPNRYWNLPEIEYVMVDGAAPIAPGIRVIPTPGHVPGHQSIIVSLPETGDVIICGDAVYMGLNFELDNWAGNTDPEVARTSALELRRLAEQGATLIHGHDPDQIDAFPRSPHVYR